MSNVKWILAVLLVLAIFSYIVIQTLGILPSIKEDLNESSLSYISLPPGFKIEVFSDGLGSSLVSIPGPNPGPRMMEFIDGTLFVTLRSQGRIVALPDLDGDNRADKIVTVISDLNKPHGITYNDGYIYIAEESRVIRFKDDNKDLIPDSDPEVLISDLPAGGGHSTRTIKIINESLFISIGSTCNVCYEQDERRASIIKCNLDGSNCFVYASGLRNSVGLTVHPETGDLWSSDNGRDFSGADLPPEEINVILEGKDYGWPICYGNKIHDIDFDKNVYIRNPCEDTIAPAVEFQAHSAPLGLVFYNGSMFPEEYKNNLFVAYHGSWNRNVPTGYKIVRMVIEEGKEPTVRDFATGWLQEGNVLGRPVDIIVAADGSLFISDDNAGVIYRISY